MDRDVRLRGNLIDDGLLCRALEAIGAVGALHEILSIDIGRNSEGPGEALIRISAPDSPAMKKVLAEVAELGGELLSPEPVRIEPAPAAGVLPDRFHVTTNLPTEIFLESAWLPVDGEEMDLAIVVDPKKGRARSLPMGDVEAGELVVVGEGGVRVQASFGEAGAAGFRFMSSEVSAEKPKGLLMGKVIAALRRVREEGGKVLFVGGPAIVHTGAGPILEKLIEEGWIDILFAGNALAAHDIEQALLGTSLGVPVEKEGGCPEGHAHHLWAINRMRRAGSIAAAVEAGLLRQGVMHACVSRKVPFVLAGSVRDDGPLPDTITDVIAAQKAMRSLVPGVGMAVMVGTTLHAVATGNLLPASVHTVCVDINPGVVTKLQDRGSRQSVGIVMDAASFLEQLRRGLSC